MPSNVHIFQKIKAICDIRNISIVNIYNFILVKNKNMLRTIEPQKGFWIKTLSLKSNLDVLIKKKSVRYSRKQQSGKAFTNVKVVLGGLELFDHPLWLIYFSSHLPTLFSGQNLQELQRESHSSQISEPKASLGETCWESNPQPDWHFTNGNPRNLLGKSQDNKLLNMLYFELKNYLLNNAAQLNHIPN